MRGYTLLFTLVPCLSQAQAVIVTHQMNPGGVIGVADVTLVEAEIPGAETTLDAVIGRAVTEVIYPGHPVLIDHLTLPQIVARNQIVSLVYEAGPLRILAKGRALSAGAVGAEIRIMNINSHATVTGLIGDDAAVHVNRLQE